MKKFVGILFIFLILASSLRDLITFATFKVNQDYIANHLCVNRFDEIPMCQGSCFLQKEIIERHLNDLDGSPSPNLQNRVELVYLMNAFVDLSPGALPDLSTTVFAQEGVFVQNNYAGGVFRPPSTVS